MKVIKKIAAIMFALVMVISMGANVSVAHAEEGAQTGTKGKITINDAVDGQIYTIYKMLDLESYDPENGLYSYKPASEAWKTFFADGKPGHDYATINENGYITWTDKSKIEETEDEKKVRLEKEAAELAQKALAYAKDTNNHITATKGKEADGTTVEFSELDLGYYLVDSNLGTLCGLNTTNPTVIIKEKNGEPTVEKKVSSTDGSGYGEFNEVNIGDKVYFQTIITVQPGAQNYVLHDTMCEGLDFKKDIQVKLNNMSNSTSTPDDYSIYLKDTKSENKTDDGCTFEIRFTEKFCNQLKENDKIYVTYSAILNGKAFIGVNAEDGSGNTNTTKLTYGENKKESTSVKTNTYTYQIPVFKYTGTEKTPLAGAKFALYATETGGNPIALKQKEGTQNYRKALVTETGSITEVVTTDAGSFSIQGLKPGNYWLEETAAPKGYNKLAKRIKIAIGQYGGVTIDGTYNANGTVTGGELKTTVEVENKSGSILPSTGGIGTTIFYIAGAFLVLISGVVLIAKKRTDSK